MLNTGIDLTTIYLKNRLTWQAQKFSVCVFNALTVVLSNTCAALHIKLK